MARSVLPDPESVIGHDQLARNKASRPGRSPPRGHGREPLAADFTSHGPGI